MSLACDILTSIWLTRGRSAFCGADRDAGARPHPRALAEERPLEGVRIGACMHVTTETANLMRTLVASGAEVTLCASNPLSTQDDTAASLVRDYGVRVYAIAGEDEETYERHIAEVVATNPQIIMDDGADLDTALHTKFPEKLTGVIGGTEETTTGVVRLLAMAKDGALRTRFSTSTTPTPGTASTTTTARASPRSTASYAPPNRGFLCGAHHGGVGLRLLRSGPALRARGMGMDVIVREVDLQRPGGPHGGLPRDEGRGTPPALPTCGSPSPATATSSTSRPSGT